METQYREKKFCSEAGRSPAFVQKCGGAFGYAAAYILERDSRQGVSGMYELSYDMQAKPRPSEEKPWLKYFSPAAVHAPLPQDTLYGYLVAQNGAYPDNAALNYYGNRIPFGRALREIDRTADAYQALGVQPGEIVTCCSLAIPETVYSLYGLNKIGGVSNMIDPRASSKGIRNFVAETGSRVLVILDAILEKNLDMLPELDVDTIIVQTAERSLPPMVRLLKRLKDGAVRLPADKRIVLWDDFLRAGAGANARPVPYRENMLAVINHTGGTTGVPKGVMLTNDGMNAMSVNFGLSGVNYRRDNRFLDIIPPFASYGVVCSLHVPFSLGLEVVLIPLFAPEKFADMVRRYRPTHTLAVPSHYERLMNDARIRKMDLSFFETAGSGGDTMNTGLEDKLNGFLHGRGCRYPLSQGYGMSEVSAAACCNFNNVHKNGSVGIPLLKTTVAVFRPDSFEELGYDEMGEICITGPTMMLGYLNNPEETARVMRRHPDGTVWIHSGDLGYMDADGFVYIKGRMKRIIIRHDGHKVFPAQLEGIIGGCGKVEACAVVAVRDRERAQGKLPMAFVKLRDTVAHERFQAVRDEILALCNAQLPLKDRLYDLAFVPELPHTAVGKIDYRRLEDDYEKEHCA